MLDRCLPHWWSMNHYPNTIRTCIITVVWLKYLLIINLNNFKETNTYYLYKTAHRKNIFSLCINLSCRLLLQYGTYDEAVCVALCSFLLQGKLKTISIKNSAFSRMEDEKGKCVVVTADVSIIFLVYYCFQAIFSKEAMFRNRSGKCIHHAIQISSAVDLLDCLATCLNWPTCRAATYGLTDQECLLSDSFFINDSCLIQEQQTYGNVLCILIVMLI